MKQPLNSDRNSSRRISWLQLEDKQPEDIMTMSATGTGPAPIRLMVEIVIALKREYGIPQNVVYRAGNLADFATLATAEN